MEHAAFLLFWVGVAFIAYTYLGYPVVLLVLSSIWGKTVKKAHFYPEPMVSVVIAARNEEGRIRERLENVLGQNYPEEKIDIIVVSDGSVDKTNSIIGDFIRGGCRGESGQGKDRISPKVRLISYEESVGKAHAINVGLEWCEGEFVVFADARQRFERNAIRELIANFADSKVGCVSGELILKEDGDSGIAKEMVSYWGFEKVVRKLESGLRSVPGATGAIYAIRRNLFERVPKNVLLDDVFIPMRVVFRGYRTIFDGKAIAYDQASQDLAQEKRRKVRTLVGNYQLLKVIPELLSPRRNPIFFEYLSHKVFRLFVPFSLVFVVLSSFFLKGLVYSGSLGLVGAMLILAWAGKFVRKVPLLGKVSAWAGAVVKLNYFAALAFASLFVKGKKSW